MKLLCSVKYKRDSFLTLGKFSRSKSNNTSSKKEPLRKEARLILLRHGQSIWNLENKFTGWADIPLTCEGEEEAIEAGAILASVSLPFNFIHLLCIYPPRVYNVFHICFSCLEIVRSLTKKKNNNNNNIILFS